MQVCRQRPASDALVVVGRKTYNCCVAAGCKIGCGVLYKTSELTKYKFTSARTKPDGSGNGTDNMKQINGGIIGPGWCGGIRANACAINPLVDELHLAEIDAERLAVIAGETNPNSTTDDYHKMLANDSIDAVFISATPESTHYPMIRDSLLAGKHVFVEKPISSTMEEADEVIGIAEKKNLKFSVGYSQRFKPKFAFVHRSEERRVGKGCR